MRTRRGRLLVRAVAGLVAAAVSLTVVMAATRPRVRVLTPSAELCVGEPIWVGARAKGSARVKVKVAGPDGSVVLKRKKRVTIKWRRWSVTAQQPGTYRTTYRSKPKKWTFLTEVTACGGGGSETPGSVELGDNDADASLFAMPNLAPGAAQEACITATYGGSLPATVRLYGSTSGAGLASFLRVTVTRGVSGAFGTCAGFQPDAADYVGAGQGVIYDGSLAGYPDDYGSGLVDPTAAAEQWTTGESHTYRFVVSLPGDAADAAQGLTAGQTFVWEARD